MPSAWLLGLCACHKARVQIPQGCSALAGSTASAKPEQRPHRSAVAEHQLTVWWATCTWVAKDWRPLLEASQLAWLCRGSMAKLFCDRGRACPAAAEPFRSTPEAAAARLGRSPLGPLGRSARRGAPALPLSAKALGSYFCTRTCSGLELAGHSVEAVIVPELLAVCHCENRSCASLTGHTQVWTLK